ncbi:MAG: nitroreductase family protein [Chloroflexota bacterium]
MASPTKTQILKPAETNYPVLDVIENRWSPRTFDSRLVEQDKLLSLFEAARWAPSSMNAQPWRFIVATRDNEAEFNKVLSVIKEGNQAWAKNAAVLMIAVAKEQHDGGYDNRHADHDVGQAIAYLSLQANSLDLYLRQMGGFYPEKAQEIFNIPEGYHAITSIALGYLGSLEDLDERFHEREQTARTRKPLSELIFSGDWDNPSNIVT